MAKFEVFYEEKEKEDWRQRYVWHTTPKTRSRTRVKIASLSPEEQERYRPKKPGDVAPIAARPTYTNVIKMYFKVHDEKDFDKIREEGMIDAVEDPQWIDELENGDSKIAIAANIPVQAVKYYKTEDGEWKPIPEIKPSKIEEFIKFKDTKFFKVDVPAFKEYIRLSLTTPVEEE